MSTWGRVGSSAIGVCLAGALGAAAAGAALLDPVSQTRTISAQVSGYDPPNWVSDSQSDSAPDFGLFDSSVTAQVDIAAGSISASAWQLSSIGLDGVSARGGADSIFAPVYSHMSGTSHFELTFDVLEPLTFRVDGYVDVHSLCCETNYGVSRFQLSGGPGNLTIAQLFSLDGQYPFFREGVLLPGQYTLIADSQIQPSDQPLSASYQLDLYLHVIPEPAAGLLLAGGLITLAGSRSRRSARRN